MDWHGLRADEALLFQRVYLPWTESTDRDGEMFT
jgi:hypothetical protein